MYSDDGMGIGSGKDLGHYAALFWRKKWLVAGFALAGTLIAAIAALALPKYYASSATIIIEDPEIPPQMIGSTVTSFAEKRLELIDQRIMTTKNLTEIINKFDLYRDIREKEPLIAAIEELRSDFKLTKINARMIDPQSGRYRSALISFNVTYRSRSPQIAQKVAAELARLYLEFNVRVRRGQAIEVAKFLSSETRRLRERVTDLENRLTVFKERHPGFVAGQGEVMMDLIDRTEAQIREMSGNISSLNDRMALLRRELEIARSSASGANAYSTMSLSQLKAEYARLTQIYGPDYPDVVRLKRRIADLEKAGGRGEGGAGQPATEGAVTANGDALLDPAVARIEAQLAALRSEQARLQSRKEDLEGKLRSYEAKALATPQLEQEFLALRRDYENAKTQYDETKRKQLVADQARVLEKSDKGERFSLLEPPQVPRRPAGPSGKVVVAGGFAGFFVLGLVVVFLLDVMDDRIYGSRQLEAVIGERPLTLVPILKTEQDRRRERQGWTDLALRNIWPWRLSRTKTEVA